MNEFLTCNEIKNLLSPYFDMELSDEETEIVTKHIENCPGCKQQLESIKHLSGNIKLSYNPDNDRDIPGNLSAVRGLLPQDIEECLTVKSNLSAFIDGELPGEKTIKVLEHVINCEFCRKQYEKVKKTSELTRNYLENSVCNEVYIARQKTHIKVIEKIRQINSKRKILSSAAAVVFVAVLGWFSILQLNPVKPDDVNINETRYIRTDRPMYVKSEEFILTELDSAPPKEVVSLLYGD